MTRVKQQAISEDVVHQLLERGLDVLGGAEALERLSEGSDDEVDRKLELFLVAFKKCCRLPPVLVEELEKEGCDEESSCRGRDQERGGGKREFRERPKRNSQRRCENRALMCQTRRVA